MGPMNYAFRKVLELFISKDAAPPVGSETPSSVDSRATELAQDNTKNGKDAHSDSSPHCCCKDPEKKPSSQ